MIYEDMALGQYKQLNISCKKRSESGRDDEELMYWSSPHHHMIYNCRVSVLWSRVFEDEEYVP